MNKTSIAWVRNLDGTPGFTWNPIVGCSAVSPGCSNCYACRLAATRLVKVPQYAGLAVMGKNGPRWMGEARFLPDKLSEPLARKVPSGVFVCDMGDLFHEGVSDQHIADVFSVMSCCPQHRFYLLTKRARRMRDLLSSRRFPDMCQWSASGWPLPNVWLGVTVEDQTRANERVPYLLGTPAAVRFLSVEPLIKPVDVAEMMLVAPSPPNGPGVYLNALTGHVAGPDDVLPRVDWVIVGGESGPYARQCHVEWVASIVDQCKAAGVPVFVKQLGAQSLARSEDDLGPEHFHYWDAEHAGEPFPACGVIQEWERNRAGTDPAQWPEDLRVREFPKGAR